jgi:glycosyltransferase involved in cell wall biosynthesis
MRIAIIGSRGIPARWGGYEKVAEELATRLVARGNAVTVYCRSAYSDKLRPRVYRGVQLVYAPYIHGKLLESPTHEIAASLHSLFRPYDIYFILGCRASWCYLPHRAMNKNVVFQTDGLDWERRKWGFLAKRYLRFSYGVAVRLGAGLVSDSQAVRRYFAETFGRLPGYLTYGANVVAPVTPAIVKGYGLDAQDYLLVVCRLEPENNTDLVIRAFAGVRTDKKLVIVGGVNYASEYVRKLRSTTDRRVMFLGPVYEPGHLDALYMHSYAYVHGHEVGGTNPALLGAMAAGCCVLAVDVPFNREVLGDAGFMWEKATEALKSQIEHVLVHPEAAKHARERAVQRVTTLYSWEATVEAHEAYFRELATRGHA